MFNIFKKFWKKIVVGTAFGCLVTVLLHLVLPVVLLIIMIGAFNPIGFFKTKELVQQFINEEVSIASFSVALPTTITQDLTALVDGRYPCPDATPMSPDIYECDGGCNCNKIDYARDRGTTKKENTLRFDGWTIDADKLGIEYIDCDFGKFTERKAGNNDKLFEWKVSDIKQGRQKMTLYCNVKTGKNDKNKNAGAKLSQFDPNAKQEWCDENPDLWLGNWGSMSTCDGRIPTCLGAMAVVPQSGVQKNIEARNYFHIGTHWYMTRGWQGHFTPEETGSGHKWLNLWTNAIPTGSYVDVVFENNTTGQQVVVPFIYFEAKDLRQGVDMTYPQFTDIRYGHVCEKIITPANDWVERDQEYLLHEYKVDSVDNGNTNMGSASSMAMWACTEDGQVAYGLIANGFYGITKDIGQTVWLQGTEAIEEFDVASQKYTGEIKQEIPVLSYTGQIVKLKKTGKTVKKNFISYYPSENDTRKYINSSFLETYMVWQNTDAQKPDGEWSDAMFNKILDKSDGSKIEISNWHIKSTRIYNKKLEYGWWMNIRDNMSSTTISSSNKVIKFCDSNCKCSICIKAEARPNR